MKINKIKKLFFTKETIANLRTTEMTMFKAGGNKDTLGTGTFFSCFLCSEHDCVSNFATCQDVKCDKPG